MLQVSVGETVTLITEPKVKSFLAGASGKEPACQCRRCKRCAFDPWVRKIPGSGRSPGEDATHSSILARRIPQTEEPGGLQSKSTGSHRVGHD